MGSKPLALRDDTKVCSPGCSIIHSTVVGCPPCTAECKMLFPFLLVKLARFSRGLAEFVTRRSVSSTPVCPYHAAMCSTVLPEKSRTPSNPWVNNGSTARILSKTCTFPLLAASSKPCASAYSASVLLRRRASTCRAGLGGDRAPECARRVVTFFVPGEATRSGRFVAT